MSKIVNKWRDRLIALLIVVGFAAFAIDLVGIDVSTEPPSAIQASGLVSCCERVAGGVLLAVDASGGEDVILSVAGTDADLCYRLLASDGSVLAEGECPFVPLSEHPDAASVFVFAHDGTSLDAATDVSATAAGAQHSPSFRLSPAFSAVPLSFQNLRSGSTPDRVELTSTGFLLLTKESRTLTLSPGTLYSSDTVAGLSPGNTTKPIYSINEMLVSGNFPGHGEFSLSASGYIYVTTGETVRVGADDYATLSVGGATSTVNGDTGFIWGSQDTVTQSGLKWATVSYGSYGGPYQFELSGIADRNFYGGDEVPFAELSPTGAVVHVSWGGTASPALANFLISHYDSRIVYDLTTTGPYGILLGSGASWTVAPDIEEFLSGQSDRSVETLILRQSCLGKIGPNVTATVTFERDTPNARFSPDIVVISRTQGGSATLGGDYGLDYSITGSDSGSASGTTLSFSAAGMSGFGVTTNVVSAGWVAKYNGISVASGSATVTVICDLSAKEAEEKDCLCEKDSGGSSADAENACVSFSQRFGWTPSASSSPWGVLMIEEEGPSESLATPSVLRYSHPMMRRLRGGAMGTAVVHPPFGHPVIYQDGVPSQLSVTRDSRLVAVANVAVPTVREVFADRSEVVYTNGVASAIVTSDGVRVPVENLGIEVLKGADGAIRQIWSATDGLLVVAAYGGRFRVNWYAPSAVGPKNAAGMYTHSGDPLKYFDFGTPSGGTTGRSFSLIEHRSAELEFHTRWDWNDEAQDWDMVRGTGTGAVTVSRSVENHANGTWTVTTSSSSTQGIASVSTKTYSGENGNALVGATSGGRATYAANRVQEGQGAGRTASSTDSLGLVSTNAYDSAGRVVMTARTGGPVGRVKHYEYPEDDATPDFTPSMTVHVAGGVTNRIDTYARIGTREEGLLEVSTVSDGASVRTNLTFRHPSVSANSFEAGRIALSVAPDGRATTNAYEAADGWLYVRTSTEGVFSSGAFSTVDGKSSRTREYYDMAGNLAVSVSEALVLGVWRETSSATNTYNVMHKRLGTARSNGKFSDSSQICTGPVWTLGEDGIATTNAFDAAKRIVASTRYGRFGAVSTSYTLDAEGRVVAETRSAPGVLPLVATTTYDTEGRVTSETDWQGRATSYCYSADGKTTTVTLPSGGTRVTTLNADGTLASVTGTAVTPEYYSYGVATNGLEWTKVNYVSPNGARWEKTYRNAFGDVVREERPGANGSVLTTEYSYNAKGQLVETASTGRPTETREYDAWGDISSVVLAADGTSRTQSTESAYSLIDGEVWRVESTTASCSDGTIASLATTNMAQLSGLSLSNESRSVSIDVRGNPSETWAEFDPLTSTRITYASVPTAANVSIAESVDGVAVRSVSCSSVTNAVSCDAFRRAVVKIDGRGNATTNAYDSLGRLASVTDPTGATTCYAYDVAGRLSAVTNALGVATVYEYDVKGNKTYEGGGTYPVAYAYDDFNVMTNMTTYRAEGSQSGDTTSWNYDEATGLLLSKTYADGYGPSYTYTDVGNLATRTWARGVVTYYIYDAWSQLLSCDYSDSTPSVIFVYDAMGRQSAVADAVGVSSFSYDGYGDMAEETVSGAYAKSIVRHRDAFGRELGYTLDNSRKNVIEYEEDSGRMKRVMFAGAWYTYSYLPGTDLKSSLAVGTAGTAEWTYEPNRDLLSQVRNTAFGSVVSQYDYVNDAIGRRTEISRSGSRMTESRTDAYCYNARNELTNAVKNSTVAEYAYQYDDIGNRITSLDLGESRAYAANALNQYAAIDDFAPQFDLDGNQTLVKTSTGIWTVAYNGENRPVSWACGATNVTMKFDRKGRRIEYLEKVGSVTNAHHRFVYDGYLCVQRLDAANGNAVDLAFGWDPTETVATRPVWMQRPSGSSNFFCFHDGNKNVSDLVSYQSASGVPAHYEYAPFGAVTAATTNTAFAAFNVAETNPFRFSSEYSDDTLGLMYYNYRHYNPCAGRWMSRDILGVYDSIGLYSFSENGLEIDWIGLLRFSGKCKSIKEDCEKDIREILDTMRPFAEPYTPPPPPRSLSRDRDGRKRWRREHRNDPLFDKVAESYGNVLPSGWETSERMRETIKKMVWDLESDKQQDVLCCPSSYEGRKACEGAASGYVRESPSRELQHKIIICPNTMTTLNLYGGCGCLMVHELLHKYGFSTQGHSLQNDSKTRGQINDRNLSTENAMVRIARTLTGKMCKGYDEQ